MSQKTYTRASFLIKRETLAQVFSCEFYEIFKDIFSTEHLRLTALSLGFFLSEFFWQQYLFFYFSFCIIDMTF